MCDSGSGHCGGRCGSGSDSGSGGIRIVVVVVVDAVVVVVVVVEFVEGTGRRVLKYAVSSGIRLGSGCGCCTLKKTYRIVLNRKRYILCF